MYVTGSLLSCVYTVLITRINQSVKCARLTKICYALLSRKLASNFCCLLWLVYSTLQLKLNQFYQNLRYLEIPRRGYFSNLSVNFYDYIVSVLTTLCTLYSSVLTNPNRSAGIESVDWQSHVPAGTSVV